MVASVTSLVHPGSWLLLAWSAEVLKPSASASPSPSQRIPCHLSIIVLPASARHLNAKYLFSLHFDLCAYDRAEVAAIVSVSSLAFSWIKSIKQQEPQTIMAEPDSHAERLENEVALAQAMYPEQLTWDPHSREIVFKGTYSSLTLRLQDDYLTTGRPIVVSASAGKRDISGEVKKRMLEDIQPGEEVLDATIMFFDELVAHHELEASNEGMGQTVPATDSPEDGDATIIVWLHHLLNTNKRKMALSPAASVSGVTKPGYPGVLVYSGPVNAVRDHVNELKGQNWAAFQVRMEADEAWEFKHGTGVKEVESMGDVVAEIGEERKEEFMQIMKIK